MNLIQFLLKSSWISVLAAAMMGSISGIGSAGSIALINRSISQITPEQPQASEELLWGFVGLVMVVLVTNLASQFLLVQLAQDAVYKLRLRISGWILASPLRHLEELGASRLLVTLTEDIQTISSAVFSVPTLCINLAIIFASLIYMGWLSIWVLLGTIYVLTMSYLMRPISTLLSILPSLSQAGVALRKIDTLGLSLASRAEALTRTTRIQSEFKQIEIKQATYSYQLAGADTTFRLGPIDLTLQPGELVFIVGGNGSGKSTLAKLLTGLYVPDCGEIKLDGNIIDENNRELYRQLFSTVFADFYLFDRFIGLRLADVDTQAKVYLEQLQLTHKVSVQDGKLSTITLSQGQRKRLALLTAYLEDRPIYLFDEWAADQDPFFREIFYQQLLPELKQRGKLVLVISHDDRYFHLADRVLKLDYGKVV